jgi:FkbM family methyltransferase
MISYTPNFEDVLLWRCFKDAGTGFYVDVGANHPTHSSVTRWFYDQGWSGINVEPTDLIQALRKERPRDVNLELALADYEGDATFYYHSGNAGTSTLDEDSPESVLQKAGKVVELKVRVSTLEKVLSEHAAGRDIHFLKIDAEGAEDAIVRSAGLDRFRPIVIVIESTEPYTTKRKRTEWQVQLEAARYRFAYFDGINDFWVRSESSELLEKFSVPINVLDGFQAYDYEAAGLRQYVAALEERVRQLGGTPGKVKRRKSPIKRAIKRVKRWVHA